MARLLTTRNALWITLATGVGAVLQFYALLRYVDRLPGDTVGIIIYAITCLCFLILAGVCFRIWRRLATENNA
ncbi:MAG: hypothetical protein K9N11_07635 [Lentisphaeria bacterium]|nr:hypothetical protein [Candidatus Neomarinimicrobiota bacterium]MCF7842707.1 hypothetical protein [Lentisphaeria bacterium]